MARTLHQKEQQRSATNTERHLTTIDVAFSCVCFCYKFEISASLIVTRYVRQSTGPWLKADSFAKYTTKLFM